MRDCVSIPCFLKDVCCPLLRAGQQLQVLVKLLNLCSVSVTREEAHMPCNIANIEEILPYWSGTSSDSAFLLNSLAFSKIRVEDLMHKRSTLYKMMLERLQSFFSNFNVRNQQLNRNVRTIFSLLITPLVFVHLWHRFIISGSWIIGLNFLFWLSFRCMANCL